MHRRGALSAALGPQHRVLKSRSLSSVLSLIQCTHYTCTVCSNYTELPAIVMPHNEAHVARRVGSHWTGRPVSACHWLGVVTVQQPSTALTPLALSLCSLSSGSCVGDWVWTRGRLVKARSTICTLISPL